MFNLCSECQSKTLSVSGSSGSKNSTLSAWRVEAKEATAAALRPDLGTLKTFGEGHLLAFLHFPVTQNKT